MKRTDSERFPEKGLNRERKDPAVKWGISPENSRGKFTWMSPWNRPEASPKLSPGLSLALSLAVTLGGVLCLPRMLVAEGRGLGFTNSFLPVLLLALALPVVHRALWEHRVWRRLPGLSLLAGFGFSLAGCLGSSLEALGYVPLTDAGLWLSLPPLTVFFAVLTGELWTVLERWALNRRSRTGQEGASPASRWESIPAGQRSAALFLFFLVVWGIVLLAVWPGFFVYDAQDEFNQAAMRSFNTHHPLPHVALLGGIILAGNKIFGSYNAGIACYMLFQMLVMGACFTFTVDFLRRKGAPLWIRTAGTVWFAAFPVIQMYVLCSAKDGLYSAGMLLFILLLVELAEEGDAFFARKGKLAGLMASAVLMASMRHNGLYILLLMIPVAVWMAGKGRRIRMLAAGCAALLTVLLAAGGLKILLHARDTENQEMLTVPIQQLARTYAYSPETFDREQEELLLSFLPAQALERYRPKLSDGVKIDFRNDAYEKEPGAFWRLWLEIGCKAPASYLNAWLLTSYGFWYPDVVIDAYEGNQVFTYTYGESSYFGYETELPGVRRSFLPRLDAFYRKLSLELYQQRVPVISMLFSPGFWFWVYALGLLFVLRQALCYAPRRRRLLCLAAAFLPALLNWLTVLLGPACLVRYVLIWWFALPVLGYVVRKAGLCYTDTKTV